MLSTSLVTTFQLWASLVLFGAALLWSLVRAPWVELFADLRRQHLFYGSVFVLGLLWLVRREFDSGLTFHFIGLTAVTLLLNWQLAITAATLAQVAMLLLGVDDPGAFGVNGLLRILIPVAVTLLISQALERARPTNLFLYIFVSGFFAGAAAAAGTILAGMGILAWSGALAVPDSLLDLGGYMLLVMFPEAFINGTVITGLVVFAPDWVETFDTDRYLQEPFDSDRRP
jgi:uncharacterized membrane protein